MTTDPQETTLRAELAGAAAAHLAAQAGDHPETARFTAARLDRALLDLSHHQEDQMSAAWQRACQAHGQTAPEPGASRAGAQAEMNDPEPEAHL